MTAARRQPTESFRLYLLAGALMIGGPVWHYLFVNRYPFSRPEALVLPLAAGLFGAGIAAAAYRMGPVFGSPAFGALLLVFLDLQFNLTHWPVRTIVLAAGCVGLALAVRSRRAILTCITLGAFDLASLPRPTAAPPPAHTESAARPLHAPPMLVHLVLDEQWGIGGLRAAGDPATAAFLTDFYLQRGFEVYEAAYSRWEETDQSIPELMSLGRPIRVESLPGPRFSLRSNPYFERLREIGYVIHVYQPSYIDYCHAAQVVVASCEVAPSVSIANIGYLRGAWATRAVLAGRFFLNMTSHLYIRLHPDATVWRRSVVGRGLAAIEDARKAAAAGPGRGAAMFIHVLLPHRPLEVDGNCKLYADLSRRVDFGDPARLSDSIWRARLALYGAQVRCSHTAVARLLAALDSTVGRDGAIVIVHGDHGLRMGQNSRAGAPLSRLDGQQLNSEFSTLLAVRRPRVPRGLRAEIVPVQDFLWQLVENNFEGEVRAAWRPYVRDRRPASTADPADTLRALGPAEMLWARPTRQ